jgi:hypothetical protein
VYVVYFKTNKRFIREYPNLREYVKDIYQVGGWGGVSGGGGVLPLLLVLVLVVAFS